MIARSAVLYSESFCPAAGISLRQNYGSFPVVWLISVVLLVAETQPKLQPALLSLSAMISQYFILRRAWLLFVEQRG